MEAAKIGGHIYVAGYIEDRVARGDKRDYRYPANGLPNFDSEFPELEPSFVSAQKSKKAQEKLS